MMPLMLLIVGLSQVHGDGHILRYYYSGFSETGSGLPEFSVVAIMDDKQIHWYNSETGQFHSVPPWMKKVETVYWDRQLRKAKYYQPEFRNNVRVGMRRFNQTEGFHTAQWMFGCELRDDGSTDGFTQLGYDGRDVIFLDKDRGLYIPIINEALLSAQEWNSPEVRWGKKQKDYLENECIEQLKKLSEYGREVLEKRVPPEVKVWGHRQSDDVTRLQCLVYGFHPRPVDVKWMRNGKDHLPSDEMSPTLPHPDGTYQIRVSVEVPTQEADTYSCHVDHSSLEDILIVNWEPNNGLPITLIAGVTIACLVVAVAVIIGISLYKKRGRGYKSTNTSETESQFSTIHKA
ncbi:class I histocompatibility antigen, F10 alpha chain-like [Lithobates pipiens]